MAAAHPYGLAPLIGFAATVGVVGYTLGGGVGWMARQYGAAAGSVRVAEVVTSDGQLLQVNEHSHSDLFWGLRGGGGNFGIVTALEFELFPVKEVFGGFVAYPLAQGKQALAAYAEWTQRVPDALTSAVRADALPPGAADSGAAAWRVRGRDHGLLQRQHAEGEALLTPLRSIGTPLLDTFRRMPYTADRHDRQ